MGNALEGIEDCTVGELGEEFKTEIETFIKENQFMTEKCKQAVADQEELVNSLNQDHDSASEAEEKKLEVYEEMLKIHLQAQPLLEQLLEEGSNLAPLNQLLTKSSRLEKIRRPYLKEYEERYIKQ